MNLEKIVIQTGKFGIEANLEQIVVQTEKFHINSLDTLS